MNFPNFGDSSFGFPLAALTRRRSVSSFGIPPSDFARPPPIVNESTGRKNQFQFEKLIRPLPIPQGLTPSAQRLQRSAVLRRYAGSASQDSINPESGFPVHFRVCSRSASAAARIRTPSVPSAFRTHRPWLIVFLPVNCAPPHDAVDRVKNCSAT